MIDYQIAVNRKSKSNSKIPNIIKILNVKNDFNNIKSNDFIMGNTFSNSVKNTHRDYSSTISAENSHRLTKNNSYYKQFKVLKSSIFNEMKTDTLNSGIFNSIPLGDKKLIDINKFNKLNNILDKTRYNSLYNTKLPSRDEYFVCYRRTDTKFTNNIDKNKKSKSLVSLKVDIIKKIQLMLESDKRFQRLSNVPIKYPKIIKEDVKLKELKNIKIKNNKNVTKYKNIKDNKYAEIVKNNYKMIDEFKNKANNIINDVLSKCTDICQKAEKEATREKFVFYNK